MLKRLAEFPRHAVFLALPVPMLVLVLWAGFRCARGPFYLGSNSDPDYAYLLNSLGLLRGHSPNHTDHPGTPVQAVGALVIAGTYAVSGSGGLVRDVLARPEHYLGVINAVFVSVCALAFLAVGLAAFALTRKAPLPPLVAFPLAMMVLMQLMPLLAVSDLLALTVVRPEPWLLCLSMALGAMLLGLLAAPARMESAKTGKWLGVIVGVGIAVKVTFLPLALIPLIVLRGRRPRAAFVLWTVLALFISLIPVLPRARQVAHWFVNLVIRKGAYGSGDLGLIGTSSILPGLKLLAPAEPVFLATLAIGWLMLLALGSWLLALRYSAARQCQEPRAKSQEPFSVAVYFPGAALRVLLALCVAGLAQFLFAAKRPVPHYMLPAFALMGTQVVVMCWVLRQAVAQRLRWVWLAGTVIVLCAAVFAVQASWQRGKQLAEQRDALLALTHDADKSAAPGRTVCYYRCSSPLYALNFGNEFCGRFFSAALAAEHPDAVFYNPWQKDFNSFQGALPREEILKRLAAGPLYFWGSDWEPYPPEVRPPELSFQVKAAAGGEVLYQATPRR